MVPEYALVYQCGIANVFVMATSRRVCQHAYDYCEAFCAGLLAAGHSVGVYHCDEAGDVEHLDWHAGAGEMFAAAKRPPKGGAA